MGFKKNNPGCGCCDSCVVFTDNFERSNSTTLGNGWTERSGNWSIVDGKLTIASPSAGNTATVTPTGDAFVAAWSTSAKLQSDTEGDELGVVLGWSDVNNRTYALLKIHNSAATVRYVRVSGGSVVIDQEEPVEAPTGMPHELRISYIPSGTPHTIVVSLNGRNVCGGSGTVTTSSLFGNHLRLAGAICGNISGTATWDDVRVDQCDHPQCAQELEFLDTFDSQRSFWAFPAGMSVTGGRLRATAGATGGRCYQLPADLTGITIRLRSKVYFTASTAAAGIHFQFVPLNPTFQHAILSIVNDTDPYRLSVRSGEDEWVIPIAGSATSGDILELRLVNIGNDLWDIHAYVNDALKYTFEDAPLVVSSPAWYGATGSAASLPMETEWDDFEFAIT